MNIEYIKEKKANLEVDICDLLQKFSKETGLPVDSISMRNLADDYIFTDKNRVMYNVNVTVKI